jgi:hypothetical protein
MQTLDSRTESGRRIRWPIALAAVVIVAVAGVVLWSLADGEDQDPQSIATELADTWVRGFDEDDPETIMSIFTSNSIFIDEDGQTFVGEEVRTEVTAITRRIMNVERVDGVEQVSDDVHQFAAEFDVPGYGRRRAVLEIELEGGLASRVEIVEYGSAE